METKYTETGSCVSFTGAIEGGHVLYTIGRIEVASVWHPENSAPLQDNWRELILRQLIRKAEEIDADAIIRVDYLTGPAICIDEIGVKLKRHRHCGQAFLCGLKLLADHALCRA